MKEWIAAFIENDEELEAEYYASLYRQEEAHDLLGGDDETRHQDGYYDDLDLDIDESVLEGLIIVTLAATLLVLVYLRQQRNRQHNENQDNAAAPAAAAAGGNPAGAQAPANGDRGFFPRPGEPEFAQWVAGGIGH